MRTQLGFTSIALRTASHHPIARSEHRDTGRDLNQMTDLIVYYKDKN